MKKYIRSAIGNIADESNDAKREIASNPETSVSVLTTLAADPDAWVRCQVALNPKTPSDVLEQLADDSYSQVRERVAANPNTPVSALARLVTDENKEVQENAAYNPNATNEILEKYNTNIDSIVAEVTEYVTEALENNLEDFLADMAKKVPDYISRYNPDWWNPDSYFNPMDIVSHGVSRGAYETLEDMVKSIMFGNYNSGDN